MRLAISLVTDGAGITIAFLRQMEQGFDGPIGV